MKHLLVFLFCLPSYFCIAQKPTPKLIVGIVVDQMRADYLYRYQNNFGENGFKKLMKEGFFYSNTHYNYMPTYTGPGHASIYTGTTPAVHGIIANDWFNKTSNALAYCAYDTMVQPVGTEAPLCEMSPKNLLTTTIGDQMRLGTNYQAKVVGISLKDRAAIFPAGHSANGAYWLDPEGKFISSTHYMSSLPDWVNNFNKKKLVEKYMKTPWELSLPKEKYTASLEDSSEYERPFIENEKAIFPHKLEELGAKGLKASPMGNTIIKDMAMAAVKGEGLGKDEHTDLLAISFSATDYVGHQFGPNAIEMEDTYIRLDKELAELIEFLETEVGKDNFVLFLTSDHGAVPVPGYLKSKKIPAGYFNSVALMAELDSIYNKEFKVENALLSYYNDQIFFNQEALKKGEIDLQQVIDRTIEHLLTVEGVAYALGKKDILMGNFENEMLKRVQRGYHQKRSGDIAVLMQPGWVVYGTQGTTHGAPYNYDSHVPLLWYGKSIKAGTSAEYVPITNIAATLAIMAQVAFPNGCTGQPLLLLTE